MKISSFVAAAIAALTLATSAAPSHALSNGQKAFLFGAAVVGTAVIVHESQCNRLSRRCNRGSMAACIRLANNC